MIHKKKHNRLQIDIHMCISTYFRVSWIKLRLELLMRKHIVYGNGESRPRKPIVGGDFITWGCNAIYRDFAVDNLVSVDYNMQQEIYESGYAMEINVGFLIGKFYQTLMLM